MRKLRINVFDDEPLNLDLFAAIVAARNYEVYASGRAIVCPVYSDQPETCSLLKPCADIILTDNRMPGMTGIEMLQEQAQRGCRIDVRNKALVSADLDAEQRKIAAGLGCAVFDKPFRLDDIFAWLDDCESRVDLSLPLGVIRKGYRQPADIETVYATAAGGKFFKGTTMNISESGLCLRTDAPLGEEESIVIGSDLPNGCSRASVRWVNKSEGNSCLAGLSCR